MPTKLCVAFKTNVVCEQDSGGKICHKADFWIFFCLTLVVRNEVLQGHLASRGCLGPYCVEKKKLNKNWSISHSYSQLAYPECARHCSRHWGG